MISNIFVPSKENNRLKAKYMKTKNLLKLMAVASCWYAEAVLAPATAATQVTVVMKANNTESVYSVSESGKVFFSGNSLVISTEGVSNDATIALTDIRKVLFSQNSSHTESISSDGNLSVYPNPATDRLYVVNATGNTDITIYSISGSVALHTVVGEGGSINIGSLQKGMYLIKMNNTVIKFSKL